MVVKSKLAVYKAQYGRIAKTVVVKSTLAVQTAEYGKTAKAVVA